MQNAEQRRQNGRHAVRSVIPPKRMDWDIKDRPHKVVVKARGGGRAGKRQGAHAGFSRILVPVGFSRESKKAIALAVTLARQFCGSLFLLHVVKPINCQADFGYGPVMMQIQNKNLERHAKLRLRGIGRRMLKPSPELKTIVLEGAAHEMIIRAAKSLVIDLIVMPFHDHSNAEAADRGNVTENTVRHAPCPVLVVRK